LQCDAGDVHEDIEPAQSLCRPIDGDLDRSLVGHVAGDRDRLTAGRFHLTHGFPQSRFTAGHHGQLSAFAGQRQCHTASDAPAPAGQRYGFIP